MNESDERNPISKLYLFVLIPTLVAVIAGLILLFVEYGYFQPRQVQVVQPIIIQPTPPQSFVPLMNTLEAGVPTVTSSSAQSITNTPTTFIPQLSETPFSTKELSVTPTSAESVVAHRPTLQEYTNTANIWDLFHYQNLTKPGKLVYNVSINSTETYRWGAVWCGMDSRTLQEILRPLSMELLIDGNLLTDDQILQFEDTYDGWQCHRWSTILSGWKPGSTVELELRYSLTERIFDGKIYVEPGVYHLLIEVKVH